MNKLDKLRKIAGVEEELPNKTDAFGQTLINKSEDWLVNNSDLPQEKKLEEWMKSVSDWTFTPNNREYYWQTMENLSTLSPEKFKEFTINDVRGELDSYGEMADKEQYFRDNANTWPSYVLDYLGGYFDNIKGTNYAMELERNRISQVVEMKDLLAKLTFDLDPDVSLETHTDDLVKAYDMGYNEEIASDNTGRISIVQDGSRIPVYTLPDPELTLQEQMISLNDLRGIAKDNLKTSLMSKRAQVKDEERTIRKALLSRAENGELPDEFLPNIIIDGTAEDANPVESIKYAVLNRIKIKEERGEYPNLKSIVNDYLKQYSDIYTTLQRRINDGKYS